jgi:hypothetical protein
MPIRTARKLGYVFEIPKRRAQKGYLRLTLKDGRELGGQIDLVTVEVSLRLRCAVSRSISDPIGLANH